MADPTPVQDTSERQLGLEELFDFGAWEGGMNSGCTRPGADDVPDETFATGVDSSNLNWEEIDQFIGSIQAQTVADNAFCMDFDTDIDQFIGLAQDQVVTDDHDVSMDFGRAHGYAPVGGEISLGMNTIGPVNDFHAAPRSSFADAGGYFCPGSQITVPDTWATGTTPAIEYGQWPEVPQRTHGDIDDSKSDVAHPAPLFSGPYDRPFDTAFHDTNSSTQGLFAARQCPLSEFGTNGNPPDGPPAAAGAQLSALKRSNDPMTSGGWPGAAGHQGAKHPKLKHIPETMCFNFVLTDPRAKNKGRERQSEINAMRSTGACFRCKMLKLQCSEGDPCRQCEKTIQTDSLAQSRFLGCFRARLVGLLPSRKDLSFADVKDVIGRLEAAGIQSETDYQSRSLSDVIAFARSMNDNLRNADNVKINLLGDLLSAPRCALLSRDLPKGVFQPFRLFLFSTLLTTADEAEREIPEIGSQDIQSLHQWSRQETLRQLDKLMAARQLSRQTQQSLAALYLVILGTIFAVNHSKEDTMLPSDAPENSTFGSRSQKKASTRTLAYYLAFLGNKTQVLQGDPATKALLDQAESNFDLEDRMLVPLESRYDNFQQNLPFGLRLTGAHWVDASHIGEDANGAKTIILSFNERSGNIRDSEPRRDYCDPRQSDSSVRDPTAMSSIYYHEVTRSGDGSPRRRRTKLVEYRTRRREEYSQGKITEISVTLPSNLANDGACWITPSALRDTTARRATQCA